MKQHILVIAILAMLSAPGEMVAQAQPITISTFAYGEDNPGLEICKLVMTEAYRRIGRTMEVKSFPGMRALATANNGEVDGELGRTRQIEEAYPNLVRVPIVILTVDIVVFTKEKTFPVEGWNSLRPYTVGHTRGIKVIENNIPEGTHEEAVATLEQAFKKLDAGRSDVVIASRIASLKPLHELGLTGITILEPPLVRIDMFHYLHVKNQHLVEPLTEVLQQMEQEGVIHKIQQQVEQSILSP